MLADNVGDDPTAVTAHNRLAPLLKQIEDPYLRAVCHLATAWTAPIVGDFDGALREASVRLEQFRQQDEPFWTALTFAAAGIPETTVERYDDALRHLTEARDLAQQLDNTWLAAVSWEELGTLAIAGLAPRSPGPARRSTGAGTAGQNIRCVTSAWSESPG